ncbi:MAG: DUF4286 family protein [Bacteroidia bacterium]|nr:DUF4286 family protein [Bacteroidia bacterium]
MIIYNVTVNVDEELASEWLSWMKDVHIPEVMRTGMFTGYRICRVLAEEAGGWTYAIQYTCNDMATYERYRDEFAPALKAETARKFGDRLVAFRTLLEVVG